MDRIINSTKEMKQRIIYIDNLKALAIFTVVIGHVFYLHGINIVIVFGII